MFSGYFDRVAKQTATRVWVNNPRGSELHRAIAAGAVCCTTNPSYCSKVMQLENDYLREVIDEVIVKTETNAGASERVYQIATQRVIDAFLPIYEESDGTYGYVTMQGDPRLDSDPDAIVEEALRCSRLGPNFMAKIPVIEAGIEAMKILVERNVPICATEVFSVSQMVEICEVYEEASTKSGQQPAFFVTHITGIFDQYWQGVVQAEHIDIDPQVLEWAGCTIARKQYRMMKNRGYPGTLLGGGARALRHFTEMVGGDLAVTLNWSTMEELIKLDQPVESRIDAEAPDPVIDELCEKLPNFRRAYEEDALPVKEFEDFGPLVLFRTMFLNGYTRLLDEIADRRLLIAR
jgi:transaldolase